ncbi:universal stress protein [Streptomyces cavernicola]|uniref:Universal stress protein n=1 Tax=Streptomyces cavernicola TaxID=3043613 RepID=A0ABT6SFB0_9ACTN|nr:universal stress protein [Streptomyces sp. B-S-A6]MDI3406873.1 universal stress protein [Streptomyces sp. B-S-A6]
MSRHVTAGLDGSPESLAAAEWGAREAMLRDVPLRLVHAWKSQPYTKAPLGGVMRRPYGDEAEENWSQRLLHEAESQLLSRHSGLRISVDEVTEEPVGVLLGAAREAEVLVLGSRGLGRLAGYLLGSVSLAVVARAERPVVLVRASEESASGDVVVGVDTAHPAEALLEFAFDAAARRETRLRVVHNWSLTREYFGREGALTQSAKDRIDEELMVRLGDLLHPWHQKHPGVAVTGEAVVGKPGSFLVEESRNAALVVVGRKKRAAAVGAHIGPVTQSVLHHAHAPVAVIAHD